MEHTRTLDIECVAVRVVLNLAGAGRSIHPVSASFSTFARTAVVVDGFDPIPGIIEIHTVEAERISVDERVVQPIGVEIQTLRICGVRIVQSRRIWAEEPARGRTVISGPKISFQGRHFFIVSMKKVSLVI